MYKALRLALAAFAVVAALGGCASQHLAPSAGIYETKFVAGQSVQHRPIFCHVMGTGGDVTLIIASIHGSEPAGTPLCEALMGHLRANPRDLRGRRVIIIPVANPDGYAAADRANDRGVDLNRNFPASNRTQRAAHGESPLSEPEAAAIKDVMDLYRPSRIVSIHQPLSCIDYDGPAEALARAMAARCNLPVKKLGARPGSLGAYAGEELGIAIITLELPGGAEKAGAATLWSAYGAAMLAAVTFEGPDSGRVGR